MQYTTNLNLKKPGSTDQALISDINDNMDTLDAQVAGKASVAFTGSSATDYGVTNVNGMKFMWKTQQITRNSGTITLPEAFVNTNYSVNLTLHATQGSFQVVIRSKTESSIDFFTSWTTGGTVTIQLTAMGW